MESFFHQIGNGGLSGARQAREPHHGCSLPLERRVRRFIDLDGTDKRKFIVADTPGHEQYTRNMVTGASTADVAVILIDARKGVLTQTRRHSLLVAMLGIRKVVLAINKLDLMAYSQEVFERIVADYRGFAAEIGL